VLPFIYPSKNNILPKEGSNNPALQTTLIPYAAASGGKWVQNHLRHH